MALGDRAWQVVGVQEDMAGDRGFTMIVPFASSLAGATRSRDAIIVLDAARFEDIGPLDRRDSQMGCGASRLEPRGPG